MINIGLSLFDIVMLFNVDPKNKSFNSNFVDSPLSHDVLMSATAADVNVFICNFSLKS